MGNWRADEQKSVCAEIPAQNLMNSTFSHFQKYDDNDDYVGGERTNDQANDSDQHTKKTYMKTL